MSTTSSTSSKSERPKPNSRHPCHQDNVPVPGPSTSKSGRPKSKDSSQDGNVPGPSTSKSARPKSRDSFQDDNVPGPSTSKSSPTAKKTASSRGRGRPPLKASNAKVVRRGRGRPPIRASKYCDPQQEAGAEEGEGTSKFDKDLFESGDAPVSSTKNKGRAPSKKKAVKRKIYVYPPRPDPTFTRRCSAACGRNQYTSLVGFVVDNSWPAHLNLNDDE